MSGRVDRKAELERKKARLAKIRAEKQNKSLRKEENKQTSTPVLSSLDQKRKDTEDLLRTVGIDYATNVVPTPSSPEKLKFKQENVKISSHATRQPKFNQLCQSKISLTSIPPRELVTYAKETQTRVERKEFSDSEDELKIIKNARRIEEAQPAQKDEEKEKAKESIARELSEGERHFIESSEAFHSFLTRTTRFVDRIFAEEIDFSEEYAISGERDSEVNSGDPQIQVKRIFSDERWSRHRMVTSLDWSTHYPELCLASYTGNEDVPYEPEGAALVWNSKYKTTAPEYTFQCQSPVTAACFAKFHPNLVVGGTYSGQIMLWDNRINKRTVQKSKLSSAAHTHPVYCMDVIGSQNAHNLMSISTDGKMCSWSLDMLSQPLDSIELECKQSRSVAVMCMDFQHNNVNAFAVGAEDGSVYSAYRHGSKQGINELYEGHTGPVSGINCHQSPGHLDFSHLLLTSSFDWTIKLWSLKGGSRTYLHSFEDRNDCVYDVMWSPVHPAVFASGDCSGKLDIWNLNMDAEVPVASAVIDSASAINKLRWNSSGSLIAAGDGSGRVHLYEISEDVASPAPEDWTKFVRTLADIRGIHQEEESLQVARQL